MDKSYVLAMYDIRGKQEFIYRSVKLKEIVGGSAIIRDLFIDYFFPAAKEYRNEQHPECSDQEAVYQYKEALDDDKADVEEFSFSEFEGRMNGDQYVGEVVYCGGGNFLVLFKDEKACKEITYRFSKAVIENTSTLKVICTFVGDLQEDRYHSNDPSMPGDYERLYAKHRITENQETAAEPYATLPVVQAEYLTSRPLSKIVILNKTRTSLSTEQFAKYKKYEAERKANGDVLGQIDLDKMVEDKGTDSLLAVIHIDGNSMGARVQNYVKGSSYDSAVTELRRFSKEIQRVCIDERLKKIDKSKLRVVVYAGDDLTIICNAHDAFEITVKYLRGLPKGYSSCAGIAIFHSHTPFADAYRIAEQCCDSAKKKMKYPVDRNGNKINSITDACLLDFHYCQAAIGNDIEKIRSFENHDEISLPWLISDKVDGRKLTQFATLEEVNKARRHLDLFGRSNTKGLLEPAQNSEAAFLMEIRRIISHMAQTKREELQHNSDAIDYSYYKENRLLLRDLIIGYDLGFGKEISENEKG